MGVSQRMDYLSVRCRHCEAGIGQPCVYSSAAGKFGPPDTTSTDTWAKMYREGKPLPNGRVHDSRKHTLGVVSSRRRVSTVGELREALADLPADLPVQVETENHEYPGGLSTRDDLMFIDVSWRDEVRLSGDRYSWEEQI